MSIGTTDAQLDCWLPRTTVRTAVGVRVDGAVRQLHVTCEQVSLSQYQMPTNEVFHIPRWADVDVKARVALAVEEVHHILA